VVVPEEQLAAAEAVDGEVERLAVIPIDTTSAPVQSTTISRSRRGPKIRRRAVVRVVLRRVHPRVEARLAKRIGSRRSSCDHGRP